MTLTEERVQELIDDAIRKHNRNASMISAALGLFFLGAFVDGFLRVIGEIPAFMGIDINLIR